MVYVILEVDNRHPLLALEKRSDLQPVLRITAWVMCYARNSREKTRNEKRHINAGEVRSV